jgi:hypothetical protein
MPETPDFKKLAQDVAAQILSHRDPQHFVVVENAGLIEEQLRLVWNARGAADIAKIEATLYADGTSRTGVDKMLDQALRSLDR